MNAETLAIARRLVACPKWEWLPGMQTSAADTKHVEGRFRVKASHGVDHNQTGDPPRLDVYGQEFPVRDVGMVPDLDDELTRLGVVAVVRRALGVPTLSTYLLGISDPDWGETVPEWRLAGIPDSTPYLWKVSSASEIDVLCRALESAQQ